MLIHWNSHSLVPNIQNKCFSERSCLDAWLTQFPLSSCLYDCLFIGYAVDNQKIRRLVCQLREADTV